MKESPIRGLGLRALLWLPLSFFFWFYFASPLVWPVVKLAKLGLVTLWPDLFSDVVQNGHSMEVTTHLLVNQVAPDGRSGIGELVLVQNPLLYGYSLPLFSGLAMATPISARTRLAHFAVALLVIWIAQALEYPVSASARNKWGADPNVLDPAPNSLVFVPKNSPPAVMRWAPACVRDPSCRKRHFSDQFPAT